jgi:hypothetical protein
VEVGVQSFPVWQLILGITFWQIEISETSPPLHVVPNSNVLLVVKPLRLWLANLPTIEAQLTNCRSNEDLNPDLDLSLKI